mmetsp:Transcript_48899/g.78796  ORF Transcript_48899/g.78796 Transcript_48899/m.78796 type:complete len:468 (+) Transcript_48899:41-1444(+)
MSGRGAGPAAEEQEAMSSPTFKSQWPSLLVLEDDKSVGLEEEKGESTGDNTSSSSTSSTASFNISSARLQLLAIPSSPERRETLRGGVWAKAPAGRSLVRHSSLTSHTHKKGEETVVSIASVTADLKSKGLMLDYRETWSSGEELGKGAMGVIYKGTHRGQPVAVKHTHKDAGFSESELVEAALHEMIMGSKIQQHPNIITFVGAVQHPTSGLLLVYEIIDGLSLEDFFRVQQQHKKTWRPKLKHSLRWGQQLFTALDVLHSARVPIIHRDVKPANIMLCKSTGDDGKHSFHVKVIDFGLAREVSHAAHAKETNKSVGDTSVNMTAKTGTYRYMAPEIFLGVEDYGCKADVYSATITLYFMITGKLAFEGMPTSCIGQRACLEGQRPPLKEIESAVRSEHVTANMAQHLCLLLKHGWEAKAEERDTSANVAHILASLVVELAASKAKTLSGLHIRARVKDSITSLVK